MKITSAKPMDITLFHGGYGQAHEALWYDTAKRMVVTLVGELQPNAGYSQGNGCRKLITSLPFG